MIDRKIVLRVLNLLLDNTHYFKESLRQWVDSLYVNNLISSKEWVMFLDYIDLNYAIGYFGKLGDIETRINWVKKHRDINNPWWMKMLEKISESKWF